MKQGRLLWRIYGYFLLAALGALALATGHAVHTLRHFYEEEVASELAVLARLEARDVLSVLSDGGASRMDGLCKDVGRLTGSRMTVILPDGRVIGDSDKNPAVMDNHATRPEIASAFLGEPGSSVRYSDTLKRKLKYVAIPVQRDGVITAVVRMAKPIAEIRWIQHAISRQLLVGGIFSAALFGMVAMCLSRRTTRPLEDMRRVAGLLAKGDLSARVDVASHDEIGALARTMNDMAEQLGDRMQTIVRQQVEQFAVLACMVEGVLAVNTEGQILYVNEAAGRLLDITPERVRGRSVQETVRHHDIQEFVMATLTNDGASESEVVLRGIVERHVQLHGTPLVEPSGRRMGGLVVVNDITRMKRLERVRTDFVANVSHELKTPITALKGCVEILSSEPAPGPGDAAHFTSMMSRHVSRLEAIVEDLLCLSRIEFEAKSVQIYRERVSIADVLQKVAHIFVEPAGRKGISLKIVCEDNLKARINGPLLEQAVGNLVDNAIKYSGEDTSVCVTAKEHDSHVSIEVADQGPGIEKSHLPRIFERFYRVDTARSRALGGTGLGLAIVKHIALAHQGNVTVASTSAGSTFTIDLPKG